MIYSSASCFLQIAKHNSVLSTKQDIYVAYSHEKIWIIINITQMLLFFVSCGHIEQGTWKQHTHTSTRTHKHTAKKTTNQQQNQNFRHFKTEVAALLAFIRNGNTKVNENLLSPWFEQMQLYCTKHARTRMHTHTHPQIHTQAAYKHTSHFCTDFVQK